MPHPQSNARAPRYDVPLALAQLGASDPKLGKLISRVGPCTLKIASGQTPFEALLRAIVYQQLHGKAAAAIHERLIDSFASVTDRGHPDPQHILDCPNEQLRSAGLSHSKALSIRDLAARTLDGTVPSLARIRRMPDEAIIDQLTQVRGIGRWTVEMMLIFRLGRSNVLPVDDYGVRKGFALTFTGLKPHQKVTPDLLPKADAMLKRARKWQPWCSIVSWYLWRACDLAAVKPASKDL